MLPKCGSVLLLVAIYYTELLRQSYMESLIFLCRCAVAPRHASHVSFHDVRVKTFSTHVTTKIAPVVRETWLFTHDRDNPNFTTPPRCRSAMSIRGEEPLAPLPHPTPFCSTIKKSASPECLPAMMRTLIFL